jgi:2'-5' RNA ligase
MAVTTIGVAIPIPEPWGGRLQKLRESFGDPMARSIPTHITLVPPTEVDDGDLEAVEKHLDSVAGRQSSFRIHLRGTGTFRPVSPVVFIAMSQGISSCEVLAEEVRQGPLEQELSFPYHPHVTVAHHLDEPALDHAFESLQDFECVFDVEAFHMYVHGGDGVWRPVQQYTLGG